MTIFGVCFSSYHYRTCPVFVPLSRFRPFPLVIFGPIERHHSGDPTVRVVAIHPLDQAGAATYFGELVCQGAELCLIQPLERPIIHEAEPIFDGLPSLPRVP
jgi:hypothetical protein